MWVPKMSVCQNCSLLVACGKQAQARVSYTPFLGGHSRSIPQGMIFDVQPLVKALFGRIIQFPAAFFLFQHLYLVKLDITFGGGGGGASKVCARRGLNEEQIRQR